MAGDRQARSARLGGFDSSDAGEAIETTIERDDFGELQLLHEYGVVAIGIRKIGTSNEQLENFSISLLLGQEDTREFYERYQEVTNFESRSLVELYQCENDLRYDCFARANS
jgi:hypothetical protein